MGDGGGLLTNGSFTPFGQIEERGRRAASVLADAGIGAGDSVALLLRNVPAFIEATLGAQHLGAYPVPINWHFTAHEIGHILRDSGAKILIAHADLLEKLDEIAALVDRVFAVADGESRGIAPDWSGALAAAAPSNAAPALAPPSMIYTSGTTGLPKGVRRSPPTPAQAGAVALMRERIYATAPGMRAMTAAPLYHSAPNFFTLNVLKRGGTMRLNGKFDAEATLATIERDRITHMFMVPTMFVRLLALPAATRARYDMSTLQSVLHAGAHCPRDIKRQMIDWWGPVIDEYYGSTEMGPLSYCRSAEWLERPGTVGTPLPGVELSIRSHSGMVCAAGEEGEIVVEQTPQADFTYHGDEAKRAALDGAGGMATGDIGYLDADGYLFICERISDMVISGGVNIYPAEIEAVLIGLPGVRDCAVFGVPHPEFGETVIACIEAEPAVERPAAEALLAGLGTKLSRYKLPREIIFSARLPRDDSGKIFKRKIKAEYLAQRSEPG